MGEIRCDTLINASAQQVFARVCIPWLVFRALWPERVWPAPATR